MIEKKSDRVGMLEGMTARRREMKGLHNQGTGNYGCAWISKWVYLTQISLPVLSISHGPISIVSYVLLFNPSVVLLSKCGYTNILCVLRQDGFGNIKSLVEDQLQTSMVSKHWIIVLCLIIFHYELTINMLSYTWHMRYFL